MALLSGRIESSRLGSIMGKLRRKPGRNDPCYCGSGKKYKLCCLSKPSTELDEKETEKTGTSVITSIIDQLENTLVEHTKRRVKKIYFHFDLAHQLYSKKRGDWSLPLIFLLGSYISRRHIGNRTTRYSNCQFLLWQPTRVSFSFRPDQ